MLDLFTLFSTMGLQEEVAQVEGLHSKVIKEDEDEPVKGAESSLETTARNLSEFYESVEGSVVQVANSAVEESSNFLNGLWNSNESTTQSNPFVIDLTLPPPPVKVAKQI